MYIELYFLDNFIMNLLILRLSSAILGVRARGIRLLWVCALGSVYAVFAYMYPILLGIWFKIPLCMVMALGIPCGGWRQYGLNTVSVIFSSFVAGGCAYMLALCFGGNVNDGFITAPVPLRAALYSAVAVAVLPSVYRKLLGRHIENVNIKEKLIVIHNGKQAVYDALIDTGNTLSAPVSALPIIVILADSAFAEAADIPIPCETAMGKGELMGFIPEKLILGNTEIQGIAALGENQTENRRAMALIPPSAIPAAHCGKQYRSCKEDSSICKRASDILSLRRWRKSSDCSGCESGCITLEQEKHSLPL